MLLQRDEIFDFHTSITPQIRFIVIIKWLFNQMIFGGRSSSLNLFSSNKLQQICHKTFKTKKTTKKTKTPRNISFKNTIKMFLDSFISSYVLLTSTSRGLYSVISMRLIRTNFPIMYWAMVVGVQVSYTKFMNSYASSSVVLK